MNLQQLLYGDISKPEVTLLVNGKNITFLCDTRACRTTVRETVLGLSQNGNHVSVRAADGQLANVPESNSVWFKQCSNSESPCVPDPYTLFNSLRPDAKFFTVVDISNVFFSVPVEKGSQFWFAFTFKGQKDAFTSRLL